MLTRLAPRAFALCLVALTGFFSVATSGSEDDAEVEPISEPAGEGEGEGEDNDDPILVTPSCGDGVCDGAEECESCQADCGQCVVVVCGNAVCDESEDCDSCEHDCGTCSSVADNVSELLGLINDMRKDGGDCPSGFMPPAPELTFDAALILSAEGHVSDMAANDYFAHASLDGRTPFDRMQAAGYTGWAYGENLAAGNADAPATFQQWVHSDGHCVLMMSTDANEAGIGYAFDASSTYHHYWGLNLGWR